MAVINSAPVSAGRRRAAHAAAAAFAVAAVGGAALRERHNVAASFVVLAHLHWLWIPAAIVFEGVSMGAFACMQRRLLATGGTRVAVRPALATTFAANALSVSLPLAGPEVAAAFTFRRFMRHGADAPLAGWSLLAGGAISAVTAALVVLGGALASGSALVIGIAVPGALLAIAALLLLGAAARRPRLMDALGRPASSVLKRVAWLLRRPVADTCQVIKIWAERLGSLRLGSTGWTAVTSLGMVNWLADAAVLVVSIRAAGGPVPWNDFLVAYGSGVAAQSVNITPGGLGVTEGTMSLALIATGMRAGPALAAVLLYRLASFWLVALAGWLVLLFMRPSQHRRRGGVRHDKRVEHGPRKGAMVGCNLSEADVPTAMHSHELVLLHGQPGSQADWDQVAERLPAQLHAVAADRPGYGLNPGPAGGFAANARAVIDGLEARRIDRAVLVGHSYGGGVALWAAKIAPNRVEAVILLASVGPGCVNVWDRVLAAPGIGPACALLAWKFTPWIARARLAVAGRSAGRRPRPDEYVNWQVWGHGDNARGTLWRTFLLEQRALLREISDLEGALPAIAVPVLVLADPRDTVVPVDAVRRLAGSLPDARLRFISGVGHHLPRRAPGAVADAICAFLAATDIAKPAAAQGTGRNQPPRPAPATNHQDLVTAAHRYWG
jgi:pimeloyl-ACP methyl ester carboxylesterase